MPDCHFWPGSQQVQVSTELAPSILSHYRDHFAMSSTFTLSRDVDMTKEKDWPLNLGMLDWDSTSIVFTKRSLVEFLKYAGVTVDPWFYQHSETSAISAGYAKFGKLTAEEPESAGVEETTPPAVTEANPNRRLLAEEFTDDALYALKRLGENFHMVEPFLFKPGDSKPSRRVRTHPGGSSSIADIFSNDDAREQFVPTRKVRERPGGKDNIEGLF
ncbi:hypothetical protein EDD16DRAFT_336519 [Pisolithus croceorrhizus]|nr:hypothetical protein EDD16DRAFT_336519 [Pisolithus croceorrhizus]